MSWHAPEVDHLLDRRLQTARLELLEDTRLQRAASQHGQEAPEFLRSLIEEKLATAARSGMGAVEASLRSSAAAHLTQAGKDTVIVRDALDQFRDELLAPERDVPPGLSRSAFGPGLWSLSFLAAWMVSISAGWLLGDAHSGLFATLAITGGAASVVIFAALHLRDKQNRADVLSDYPVALCRYYVDELARSTARYEAAVGELTHSAERTE
jgi:hypothetical protein